MPTKKTTVYLDADLHKALRLKAIETSRSLSDLINEAIRQSVAEDAEGEDPCSNQATCKRCPSDCDSLRGRDTNANRLR